MQWIEENWLKLVALAAVAVVFLPIAGITGELPYAYYQYMNWIVVLAALMTTYQAYTNRNTFLVAVFGLLAITFNPISPMYLRTDIWQLVDIIAILLFVFAIFISAAKEEVQTPQQPPRRLI